MPRFRKRPVVIDAMLWTGDNTADIAKWVDPDLPSYGLPEGWWLKQIPDDDEGCRFELMVPRLEGEHQASPGDMIIRGVAGEYYPCKPEIFAQTYEPAP